MNLHQARRGSRMAQRLRFLAVAGCGMGILPFGMAVMPALAQVAPQVAPQVAVAIDRPAATPAEALAQALSQVARRNWDAALAIAPAGLGRDLIEWHRLRAGEGALGDYEDFLKRHGDWPGLPLLREKGEIAVARSITPSRVQRYFSAQQPVTGKGAAAYIKALQGQGLSDAAEDAAMRAWSELNLSAEDELELLSLAPHAVALAHELRIDRLLWQGRSVEAERMLPRLPEDWRKLAQARIALRKAAPGVNDLIAAVPSSLADHPGLAFERFLWRMKRDMYADALPLLLERSTSADALGDPAQWAERRLTLSRWLMRQGRAQDAYRAASRHHLTRGGAYVDLEFLSGFLALRKLDDPTRALQHFKNIQSAASTSISVSRALYWQGRAQEALGQQAAAKAAYQAAARHQTAYYGLLATERLGAVLDARLIGGEKQVDWRQGAWTKSSVHQAALLALKAGDRNLAKRFWLHLAESQSEQGLTQMGAMALSLGEPHIAVLIGKAAAERGVILPDAYYPLTDLVPDGLAVSRAFSLAIARRESEFDPTARSTADARGLMQVLPGTGQMMAKKLGLPFEASDLIRDPAFNAKIGSAYLAHLIDEFGPSIALVASGYNAGPGRPRAWIKDFGDPRRPDVDVVDWVEQIPFGETRTYVMRVSEGVVLYRAKLRGSAGLVRLTAELKG